MYGEMKTSEFGMSRTCDIDVYHFKHNKKYIVIKKIPYFGNDHRLIIYDYAGKKLISETLNTNAEIVSAKSNLVN